MVSRRPSPGVYLHFRALGDLRYHAIRLRDPALTFPFPARLRGLPGDRLHPRLTPRALLSCASALLQSPTERCPPTAPIRETTGAFPGVCSSIATSARGVYVHAGYPSCLVPPSAFLTPSTVFSASQPCEFVSPRSHVRGLPFMGFPRLAGARSFDRTYPLDVAATHRSLTEHHHAETFLPKHSEPC